MRPSVVFFDLGRTLGRTTLSADHCSVRSFEAFPRTVALLPGLAEKARLGVIATGYYWSEARVRELLETAGVARYLEKGLIIHLASLSRDGLEEAATRAGVTPSQCLYVSKNGAHRWRAVHAGMRGVPHPALVAQRLDGEPLRYIRVDAAAAAPVLSWNAPRPLAGVVPLQVTGEQGRAMLYAISSASGDAALKADGIEVESVAPGVDVATTSLFLLRPGPATPEELQDFAARLEAEGLQPQPSDGGIIVSLPAGRNIDEFHPPRGLHGHTLAMLPSRTSISAAEPPAAFALAQLGEAEKRTLKETLTPALMQGHLDRLCGLAPLEPWPLTTPPVAPPPDRCIVSRHVSHAHNAVAVRAIQSALANTLGEEAVRVIPFGSDFGTLFNIEGEVRGGDLADEILIVGAHLDSTAANSPPYYEDVDPAPGADDDGSGVAAVLAIATVIKALCGQGRPRRTIRFVLFNAEEVGMMGSNAYATDCRNVDEQEHGRRIVAMLQLDMIGYVRNGYPPETFELHTPSKTETDLQSLDPAVIQRCSELANIVADSATLSPDLGPPQFYPLPECDSDPAHSRSDHRHFIALGWPACLVVENWWTEMCSLPGQKQDLVYPHPGYHTTNDRSVNYQYAADISRIVAGALWRLANG